MPVSVTTNHLPCQRETTATAAKSVCFVCNLQINHLKVCVRLVYASFKPKPSMS